MKNHIFCIAWIAFRELLYERIFYLFAALAFAFLGASALLGQMTYAEQTKLTLDFLLGATQLSMMLFSVFMGISLFQREFHQGSIYLVLSKPVSRVSFLIGKYLGQCLAQALLMFLISGLAVFFVRQHPGILSLVATLQTLTLIFVEACLLGAVTFFFAANTGSVTTAVASFCYFGIGHLGEAIEYNLKKGGDPVLWQIIRMFTPDLDILNMKSLASYGQSLPSAEFALSASYGLCCIAFFLICAAFTFQRKDLVA